MSEQIRKDLNRADAIVRACWDNFKATEPTYVLRDLIVVEIVKAREAEREACAAEMDLRAEERSGDLVAKSAYRNAARAIRARS